MNHRSEGEPSPLYKRVGNAAKNFVRAAPLNQIGAGFITAEGVLSGDNVWDAFSQGRTGLGIAFTVYTAIGLAGLTLIEYRAGKKYKTYKNAKRLLKEQGWGEERAEKLGNTWCERNILRVASLDTGYTKEFDVFMREKNMTMWSFLK